MLRRPLCLAALTWCALCVTAFFLRLPVLPGMTSADESRSFEYHRRYLDIFTLAAGEERVDIASPANLTVHEQHDDYWGCKGEAEQSVILIPGSFLVLFPGDAHRPGMAVTEPENISRIVFKILIDQEV